MENNPSEPLPPSSIPVQESPPTSESCDDLDDPIMNNIERIISDTRDDPVLTDPEKSARIVAECREFFDRLFQFHDQETRDYQWYSWSEYIKDELDEWGLYNSNDWSDTSSDDENASAHPSSDDENTSVNQSSDDEN